MQTLVRAECVLQRSGVLPLFLSLFLCGLFTFTPEGGKLKKIRDPPFAPHYVILGHTKGDVFEGDFADILDHKIWVCQWGDKQTRQACTDGEQGTPSASGIFRHQTLLIQDVQLRS